ncbi:GAF domain-containing protein [Sorangium sp. So ce590]|uniref:GAF domain-containing protein n=1 Tax=unclassified Sorangium TaxID=2621164 RepID=UPI003F629798
MATLERLLELPAADLRQSLNQASELLCSALDADKIDVFLFEPSRKTLRAMGTSNTPLGRLQHALGLDVQAVANGGSIAGVFTTGDPYITGHADREPGEVPGVILELGIRSHMAVPLVVEGELITVMAHDLRNYLGPLMNRLDLLPPLMAPR